MKLANIKKLDKKRQIVWGEVYCPNVFDSDWDFMTRECVMDMAHTFLSKNLSHEIDFMHQNENKKGVLVESFIAREGDPDFIPHSWVAGVKCTDETWKLVENGEIRGFSIEAQVRYVDVELEIEVPDQFEGETFSDETGHTHTLKVSLNQKGEFVGGHTSKVDGHFHIIKRRTKTLESNSHSHDYSFTDLLRKYGITIRNDELEAMSSEAISEDQN